MAIKIILLVIPAAVVYYTATFGLWNWNRGNRKGAWGVLTLALISLALSVYAIFFSELT